jgi:single-strand DNA-binding protein
MYNKVILIGNLTRDVELKYTPSGTAVAKFGLATNRTYKDTITKENKQEVMFIDITMFGRSAETANQWLRKGKKVLIEGRLVLDQWTDQTGQKRSKHSVVAEKMQFMDNKNENSGAGSYGNSASGYQRPEAQQQSYNNNQYTNSAQTQQPAVQQTAQQTQTENIPSIDIDEEDIPF